MVYMNNINYNWGAIGKRIKKARKELSLSQEDLSGIIFVSRQLLSKWERALSCPTLDDLLKLCNVFNCELGYLLCEFDNKTREETDIHKVTGLSEKAIRRLKFLKPMKNENSPLNPILEHDSFIELLEVIRNHVWSYNQGHYDINCENPETIEALTATFNCEPSDLKKYIEVSSQSLITSTLMKIVNDIK